MCWKLFEIKDQVAKGGEGKDHWNRSPPERNRCRMELSAIEKHLLSAMILLKLHHKAVPPTNELFLFLGS